MGLGVEQESVITPTCSQMQVIGSKLSLPSNVLTTTCVPPLFSFGKCMKNHLILPTPSKSKLVSSNFFEQPNFGTFPDSCPPVSMYGSGAFSDEDQSYFRSLQFGNLAASFINLQKVKVSMKQCPGGGGANGGGAYNNGGSQDNGSSWAFGNGGGSYGAGSFGGGVGGGAGGGDDDPSKWQRTSKSAPLPIIDADDDFNSLNYLDDAFLEDLIRDIPLMNDIVLSTGPQFGFPRDQPSYSSYPTESSDPPSTPAPPLTPGPLTPMQPSSVNCLPQVVNSPPQSTPQCVQPSDTSDMQNLLDIQKLMINGSDKGVPVASTLVPSYSMKPSYPAQNTLLPNRSLQPQYSMTQRVPTQQQTSSHQNDIDFLTAKMTTNDTHHCIEVFVPRDAPQDKQEIGFRALQHCYTVYLQYQDALKNQTPLELQVANQQIASLCPMEFAMSGTPNICFKMPKSCIHLQSWVNNGHTVVKRQIVLQQLINTLSVLFKAENNLCFWGSSQIYIDQNLRVYLYIDFIKALAIQKDYAENGLQRNPRIEDCKVLTELYNVMLKPFLQRDFTWVSPQLKTIFDAFESSIQQPETCVSNMAYIARVLGERRICKLEVNLMLLGTQPLQYTIFCAEHEPISSSMEVISGVLPMSVAWHWTVVHSHDNSPVSVSEIATKEKGGLYTVYPIVQQSVPLPGALYIVSKQQW